MFKRIVTFVLVVIALCLAPLSASANEIDELLQDTENAVEEALPDDAQDQLQDYDISVSEPESLNNISFEDVLRYIVQAVSYETGSPIKLLAKLSGILLICSLISSMSDENNKVIENVGTLATVMVAFSSISATVDSIISMLDDVSSFMLTYTPAFVGVITSSGAVSTATGYYSALLILCEGVTLLATWLLPAVCGVILAVSVSQSVCIKPTLTPSTELRKFVNRLLAFVATVFVGVLSIKSFVGAAADSVITRSAKFAASSFVPVVGSAVSEAYSTVTGSLSLIRSSTGAIGMLAVLFTVMRPVMAVVLMSFAVKLAGAVAKLLSLKSQSTFLGGVSDTLSVLLTASIIIAMLFIVSTAVMMLACMGI